MSEELKVLSMVWGDGQAYRASRREARAARASRIAAFLSLAFGRLA